MASDAPSSTGQHPPYGAQRSPVDLTRVVLRPVASSAPLSFFAFGVGTILYTAFQLQWVPISQTQTLSIVLLAFVAPLELIAGLIAFTARDGGLATTMSIFGAVWAALSISMLTAAPGSRSPLLGIFLLTIAAMLLAMSAVSVQTRPLLFVLSLMAAVRYALSGVYELTGSTGVEHASGWLGIPIVAISIYGGAAFLMEDMMRKTVLPVGRRNDARAALEGGLGQQVERITQEAGIREQL